MLQALAWIAAVIFIAFVAAMLSSCGHAGGKSDDEVRQEQADYMRKQAANTNQGIRNLRQAQAGHGEMRMGAPAPAPEDPSTPVPAKRGDTQVALR